MGPYLYFRVLIFTVIAIANFDFYLCLRINFHTSSFWVLILAASGPYITKKWVLIGSLSQSLGVFISFRDSALLPRAIFYEQVLI